MASGLRAESRGGRIELAGARLGGLRRWLSRQRGGGRPVYWLLLAPALILMLAFYVYPLVQVLVISVTEPRPGLDNYALLVLSEPIQKVLRTTARISVITTGATLVLGYVVAYVTVHATARVQRWLLFGVLLPFWVSVLVRAFAWIALLRSNGIVNETLQWLGLIDQPLALVRNELGVVIGMIHYMLPFAVLPLYANMRGIDRNLVAAARGLGASPREAFLKVFLPLSIPGLVGAGVLVFIYTLGFYVTPAILGGGRTIMIAEYVQVQILDLIRWGTGAMLATALVIAIFAILAMLSRFMRLRQLFGAG